MVRKGKTAEYKIVFVFNKEVNPIGHQILKKILLLPLLRADLIKEGLKFIEKEIKERFKNDRQNLNRWTKFLNKYFRSQWMNRVKPETFSVFYLTDRTNNALESYHHGLNTNILSKPSVSKLFSK